MLPLHRSIDSRLMPTVDAITDVRERLGPLIAPINGGVGADVSYDEAFERMKVEVEKLTSMVGGKVDWAAIASNAQDILTERGKDFRVALYFLAARTHLDGLLGLLEGFVVLQALIASFWETMGPALKRPRARGNLCVWVSELCTPLVATLQPLSRDRDVVVALDNVSAAVDRELAERLGDAYGGMSGLRSSITNIVRSLPAKAPPPPAEVDPPVAPAASPEPVVLPSEVTFGDPAPPPTMGGSRGGNVAPPIDVSLDTIVDLESAARAIAQCGRVLVQAAAALHQVDLTDAVGYRLLRTAVWIEAQDYAALGGRRDVRPRSQRRFSRRAGGADRSRRLAWARAFRRARARGSSALA